MCRGVLEVESMEWSTMYPLADAGDVLVLLIQIAIIIIAIAGMWKTFEKAGHPGWAAIIPIYNIYIMTQIAGRPWWWLLLCLIPIVNVVILIILSIDIARNFGKGPLFGLGLGFLGFIFYPILGFGDARYTPPQEPRGFPVQGGYAPPAPGYPSQPPPPIR
jgi:hypothetical protein